MDHASEQEQLEWALAESMKTGHQEKGIIWDKDHVTPPFPNVNGNGYENGACTDVNKEKNSTETYTGLKDRQKQPVENDFIEFNPENEVKNNSISEWLSTQEKLNENEDDAVLMEVSFGGSKKSSISKKISLRTLDVLAFRVCESIGVRKYRCAKV